MVVPQACSQYGSGFPGVAQTCHDECCVMAVDLEGGLRGERGKRVGLAFGSGYESLEQFAITLVQALCLPGLDDAVSLDDVGGIRFQRFPEERVLLKDGQPLQVLESAHFLGDRVPQKPQVDPERVEKAGER